MGPGEGNPKIGYHDVLGTAVFIYTAFLKINQYIVIMDVY
jgi:hypothetical protein